jgi:hypothetical protein
MATTSLSQWALAAKWRIQRTNNRPTPAVIWQGNFLRKKRKMNGRCKLIDDYLRGKVDRSVCEIVEKLYGIIEFDISISIKADLYVTIGMIYQKKLSTKEEQEINNVLNSAKNAFNNTTEPSDKEEAISSAIERILEIICS